MNPASATPRGRRARLASIGCASALCLGVTLHTSTTEACERLAPWSRLPESASTFVGPLPLSLTAGALIAPFAFAPTGLDHELRVVSQRDLGGSPNAEPVSVIVPYALPAVLVVVDAIALPLDACEVARPTSAMLQAVVFTVATVGALKWVTSRSWPNDGGDPSAPDRLERPEIATQFHWFDWNAGFAWPSGHTATMFAAATALATLTHHRHWSGYVAYAAATGVALGMWLGDHHWGSDILSGALLGAAVGYSTGRAFRPENDAPAATTLVVPWIDPTTTGLRVVGTF